MELETERLKVSQLRNSDAPFFYQLVNDPDWKRFIGDRQVYTIDKAEAYLNDRIFPSYLRNGFGFHKVSLKLTEQPIGISGIIQRDHLAYPDLGFAFLPLGRGQGFAYESAKAILDYAREKMQLKTVLAIANQDNIRSHQLLKKLGLTFQSKILMPDEDQEICLFSNSGT